MHESDPELALALRSSLHRLKLAEDYCDMFDRLVDMSDIASFNDGPRENAIPHGVTDPATAYSRSLIYPGATAFAYINEIELRQIRARSRVFAQLNPYAIGAARNRMAYAVGSGHTYNVLARGTEAGEALLDDCRKVLEDFRKRNQWSKRQKETVRRLDRDGERFLRLFVDKGRGELNVRFVEPLEIQNPPNLTSADGVYFGIQYARVGDGVDIETPVAYFLVNIGTLGESIGLRETVPADEMQHLKVNVDMTWPRGLPTWYPLQGHLNDAVKTLKATGKIVEFRARIAMIRRHVNATKSTLERTVYGPKAGGEEAAGTRTAGQYPYAAIIDTSDATDYDFPSGTAPVDKNVAAIQAELRAAAAALAMPEYMLSGDASNANFSSTMVAEGPAVKTFEELQADLIEADVEILERQLAVAARAGLIQGAGEADILERVKVEAEPPLIKSENRLQEAQADQILRLCGVMSKESMAARHGLVYADEHDKMATESESPHAPGQGNTQYPVLGTQPPRSPASNPQPLPQGLQEYWDGQPRDDHGKWTAGGSTERGGQGAHGVSVLAQVAPKSANDDDHPPITTPVRPLPAPPIPGEMGFTKVNDVIAKLKQNPEAKALLEKALAAGVKIEKDTRIELAGAYNKPTNTIRLNPDKTGSTNPPESVLLFELLRIKHLDEQNALDQKAKANTITKEAYAVESEKLTFKYIQEHREIAQKAIQAKQWEPATDRYNADVFSTWEKYIAAVKATSHYDQNGVRYDYFQKK